MIIERLVLFAFEHYNNMCPSVKCRTKFKEWSFFKLQLTSQDTDADKELMIDEMTWRQFLNNALKKSHGLFGEGCEYYFLNQHNHVAYVKVFRKDGSAFSSAITTFVSSEQLVGIPLVALIIQNSDSLTDIKVEEDDKIWYTKVIMNECDDSLCTSNLQAA